MTKAQLKEYGDIKTERDDLARKIEQLATALYSLKSPSLDGMPRGGAVDKSARDDMIKRKDALMRLYAKKVKQLDALLLAIEEAIAALPARERLLLRLHYVDGLTLEKAAERMHYSSRTVDRIHERAIWRLERRRR